MARRRKAEPAERPRCSWVRMQVSEAGETRTWEEWVPQCLSGLYEREHCTCDLPTPPKGHGLERCSWVKRGDLEVFVPCCYGGFYRGPEGCTCPMPMVSVERIRAHLKRHLHELDYAADRHNQRYRRLTKQPRTPKVQRALDFANELSRATGWRRRFVRELLAEVEIMRDAHHPEQFDELTDDGPDIEQERAWAVRPTSSDPPPAPAPSPPTPRAKHRERPASSAQQDLFTQQE